MSELTNEQLKTELGRAYRALRGLYGIVAKGEQPDTAWKGYHSLTLAAAMRYVSEDAIDGTAYFVGKNVSELHRWLAQYSPQPTIEGDVEG